MSKIKSYKVRHKEAAPQGPPGFEYLGDLYPPVDRRTQTQAFEFYHILTERAPLILFTEWGAERLELHPPFAFLPRSPRLDHILRNPQFGQTIYDAYRIPGYHRKITDAATPSTVGLRRRELRYYGRFKDTYVFNVVRTQDF